MAKTTAKISAFGVDQSLSGTGTYRIENGCVIMRPDAQVSPGGIRLDFPERKLTPTFLSAESNAKIAELKALLDVDYATYNNAIEQCLVQPEAFRP